MSEQDQEVQPQATEENVAPDPASTAEQEVDVKEPEQKVFTQEELDKIVSREKAKLERRIQRNERETLKSELRAELLREVQQPKAAESDSKPLAENYQDYAKYLEDLAEYKAREIVRRTREETAQAEAKKSEQYELQRLNDRNAEIMEIGNEKYEGFEDIPARTASHLASKGLRLTQPFVNALMEADNAPEIIVYLGDNPAEAERIARLSAFAQAKEVGKLEEKLKAPPQKQISKAPEPIKPVGGGKTASDTDLSDDLPINEWMARRNKQARGR